MCAMLFDICIGNETSGTGAEYLQLTGRQAGRRAGGEGGREETLSEGG